MCPFTLESMRSLITGFNLAVAFPLVVRLVALLRASGKLTVSQSDLIGFSAGGHPRLCGERPFGGTGSGMSEGIAYRFRKMKSAFG